MYLYIISLSVIIYPTYIARPTKYLSLSISSSKAAVVVFRRLVRLRAVYTRVFRVRFSVRDCAAAQQLPLLFRVRENQRKLLGGGAITDGETDAK
jgi:hypothetical protein